MKAFILSAMVVWTSGSAYANEKALKFEIDWNDKESLNDNGVLQCDDEYHTHAEIKVPGKAGRDFYVVIEADVTDGKEPTLGCKVSKSGSSSMYKVHVDTSCTIKIYQALTNTAGSPKVATIELSDAC